jgi:hypothetical protein
MHRAVRVTIASQEPERSQSLQQLAQRLASLGDVEYAEVWVEHDMFPSVCALIHGDRAWLMYLRYDGDAGFSSRNPAYEGSSDATIDYYLSNGQRDVYPAAWAYPTPQVLEAVSVFAKDRRMPESIVWFNDSDDGTTSPNDPWDAPTLKRQA